MKKITELFFYSREYNSEAEYWGIDIVSYEIIEQLGSNEQLVVVPASIICQAQPSVSRESDMDNSVDWTDITGGVCFYSWGLVLLWNQPRVYPWNLKLLEFYAQLWNGL